MKITCKFWKWGAISTVVYWENTFRNVFVQGIQIRLVNFKLDEYKQNDVEIDNVTDQFMEL